MKLAKFFPVAIIAALLLAGCQNDGNPKAPNANKDQTTKIVKAPADNPYPAYEDDEASESAETPEEPQIKLVSNGSILPSTGNMDLLFSSVGYAGARVRVRKIFTSNILQFLQYETYERRYELYKVARVVADTTLVLGSTDAPHIRQVRNYAVSLDELITPEPGAIYHVEIRGAEPLIEEDFWDSDTYFGNYETYDSRNTFLMASDIALIAKSADNSWEVFATDILSGAPLKGVKVKLYDDVLQEVGKGVTDKDGRVSFPSEGGRYVLASSDKGNAYLALKYEKSLSTSAFDVSGASNSGGLKTYIFGERGVWRPGDTLHISAITMADGDELPIGHPVTAQLRNPDGRVTRTLTVKNDGSHIYHFPFTTDADAPTGRWSVSVKVGNNTFSKSLKVETVKPNKLDVTLSFDDPWIVPKSSCAGTVSVKWLYGAVGSGLKVNGDIDIKSARTSFKGYEDYDFRDDTRSFSGQTLYYNDMTTNIEGKCYINTGLNLNLFSIPGMLEADFTMRAFEPSGEFSTGWSSWKMSPFDAYVGIKADTNKSEWGEEYLKQGENHKFDVVTVGPDGKPVSVSDLHAEIYHVDWSWWWNSSAQIASYMSGKSKELMFEKHIATHGGTGSFSYDWADAPDGLYFVRVTDEKGGHASSMLCEVYENYSSRNAESTAATRLSMNINKDKFKVGETAKITIPSSKGSKALVSIEKAGRILRADWINCSEGSTEITIPVNADMLPNAYAFVTLVQPHATTLNDAPIRLYGVQNINVEDPASHLEPVIDIPDDVKPETTLNFKVKEKNGKAMSYIVALVDEGLLGLTSYKTPDAWNAFYAKEALRVRTWDLYDDVIGAYGGRIEQLFAIGGDDEADAVQQVKPQNANRFKPVVSYLGPFTLKGGKTGTHSIEVPQYIGALRAMVIATDGRAQGSSSKDVTVTKPVMVQATLPRALNIGETVKVPVTLLTMKKGVGKVKLSVAADDHFQIVGPSSMEVNSADEGQEVYYFEAKVMDNIGIGHFKATAEASGDKSVSNIEIDINNPNPEVTRSNTVLLAAGETKDLSVALFGTPGTNSAKVEFSTMPAIDLNRRLKYLIEYPYGCVEQTVSSAFPQLYLDKVSTLDEKNLKRTKNNVEATIRRLQSFRLSDGSLSYWPGSNYSSEFGSAYALHFLQEAENQGYAVPADLKKDLIKWLTKMVGNSKNNEVDRAYGVYALAAAGKPNRSAMNLLRENAKKLQNSSAWLLAASYAIDGKKNVCRELIAPLKYADGYYYSYGSSDRNLAVALKTMLITGNKEEAFKLADEIANNLNNPDHWMSTQSTAWSLYAVCDYASTNATGINAGYNASGSQSKVTSDRCFETRELPIPVGTKDLPLKITNNGSGNLYAVASVTGIPAASEEKAMSNKIKMTVTYFDESGAEIKVDTLSRGRQISARVVVTNTGKAAVNNLALNHKFPSGWEIQNDRLYSASVKYPAGVEYQDFRDDRVYSFFGLGVGKSVTIDIKLIAAYPGRFYLPAVSCNAMYDDTVSALVPGKWIEVK